LHWLNNVTGVELLKNSKMAPVPYFGLEPVVVINQSL
jgi:hypothetical protein